MLKIKKENSCGKPIGLSYASNFYTTYEISISCTLVEARAKSLKNFVLFGINKILINFSKALICNKGLKANQSNKIKLKFAENKLGEHCAHISIRAYVVCTCFIFVIESIRACNFRLHYAI